MHAHSTPRALSAYSLPLTLSCASFFPQAFAQGALTSENPRLWYWATALYAMPLLRNGFELDWFSIAMVVLGAAHVQVGLCCFLLQRPWCGGGIHAYSVSMHTHIHMGVLVCLLCNLLGCIYFTVINVVNICACVDFPPCARAGAAYRGHGA